MKKNINNTNFSSFNIDLNQKQIRIILIIIIIFLIILLFRKSFSNMIERIIVFSMVFLLFLIISKNLIITFIGSCIIFLLLNLIISYRNTIENFEDLKVEPSSDVNIEPSFDTNIFNSSEFEKSANGIQDLLKLANGGIKLTDNDLKETDILNIDTQKHSDDKKPNALRDAQKETFELINTVNALKDTITTLGPVLQEGKKLMSIFENIKL